MLKSVFKRERIWDGLAVLAAGLVWLRLVWRAVHQAITIDEALTWLTWVSRPWGALFDDFFVNNHILFTALAKLSVDSLGASPGALRLPSLLGALVFFYAGFRILRGGRPMGMGASLGWLLLITNPFVLDFLCAARGYGLALAFLLLCLWLMGRYLECGRRRPAALVCIGLVMALVPLASLAYSFGAMALGMAFTLGVVMQQRRRGLSMKQGVLDVLAWCASPAIMLVAVVLIPLLKDADFSLFYYGNTTWMETLRELVALWLRHVDPDDLPGVPDVFLARTAHQYGGVLLLFFSICAVVGAWFSGRLMKRDGLQSRARVFFFLTTSGFCLTLLLHSLAAHLEMLPLDMKNVLLPKKRTALHLVVLLVLASTSTWLWWLRGTGWRRLASGLFCAALLPVLVWQGSLLGESHFAEWQWDAGSRRVFEELHSLAPADRPLKVASATFHYANSLNFYRAVERSRWLAPVDGGLKGKPGAYDYVLLPAGLLGHPAVVGKVAEIVYRDPESGCCILILK